MATIDISPEKVAWIIVRAREIEAKTAPWDTPGDEDENEPETILEDSPKDATEDELKAYIADLNTDEKASLVAIMWIGRETFAPEDLEEAIETAREEGTTPTEDYLLGIPLLADYLADGLEALGYDVEEYIDAVLD